MAKHFGRAFIAAGGKQFNSKPGASLDFGGVERTEDETDHDIGFYEKRKAATVEFEIPHTADISLEELSKMEDVTVTFKTDVGTRYVLPNGWIQNTLKTTGGGGISVTYKASVAKEVKGAA